MRKATIRFSLHWTEHVIDHVRLRGVLSAKHSPADHDTVAAFWPCGLVQLSIVAISGVGSGMVGDLHVPLTRVRKTRR